MKQYAIPLFLAEVDPNPRANPPEHEIRLGSIEYGAFDLRKPAKLELASESGRCVLRWREANVEVSGVNSSEALQQFRSYIIRHANDPNIEPFLKSMARGEKIRAFKPAEG